MERNHVKMVIHFTMLFVTDLCSSFYMDSGGTGMNAYPSLYPTDGTITITTPD